MTTWYGHTCVAAAFLRVVFAKSVGEAQLEITLDSDRGKVISQEANKLQMPFSTNLNYSRDPISKMSINCRSPSCQIGVK